MDEVCADIVLECSEGLKIRAHRAVLVSGFSLFFRCLPLFWYVQIREHSVCHAMYVSVCKCYNRKEYICVCFCVYVMHIYARICA
jgi:hypothetical protein